MEFDNNEVLTNVVVKVTEDAALGIWTKVKSFFKDLSAHDDIELGLAFEEYIKNTEARNSKTKTLIYRHVPKFLYSFYECVGVRFGDQVIDTASINNIISRSNKTIITGTGGIGKTTMLKHLFLNTISDTSYIPVMIELRATNGMENDEILMHDIIYSNLVNNGFKMEEKYFDYSLENGGYVILLDGFDEVNKSKLQKVTEEIIALSTKYPQNKYILTSRPTDSFVGWNDFVEMHAMNLTKEQALSLVNKIEFDETVKSIFCKELDERLFEKYQSFASNPLLLTIMLLTFDNHASIPDRLNDFYEQAFATLFNMHDATKEAYVRDIRTGLGCEDFKMIFAYFCFKSYFEDDTEFNEVKLRKYLELCQQKFPNIKFKIEDFLIDLTQSVCMLIKEGINYRFTHRSFQEYFAAWYTCKLVDEDQVALLTNWIKESDAINTDAYFTMLFNLQSEKVNKIILCPGIKQVRKKYIEKGFSGELLNYLFKGVTIDRRTTREGEKKYSFSLRIKNKYLCNILRSSCRLNGYLYPEINVEFESKMAEKFKKYDRTKVLRFDEVFEEISEEDFLKAIKWFEEQLQFIFNVADCLEEKKKGKRRMKDVLARL